MWAWVVIAGAICAAGVAATVAVAGQNDAKTKDGVIDDRQATISSLEAEVESLNSAVTEAQGATEDAQAAQAAAESVRDEASAAQIEAEGKRDEAVALAEAAKAERDAVLLQFDPQIQAAVAELQAGAATAGCTAGTDAGARGDVAAPQYATAMRAFFATIPEAILGDRDPTQLFDQPTIETAINDCFAAAQAQYADAQAAQQAADAAAAQEAVLYGPHGNGLYTVGIEMGAGKWRSNGTADDCYWKRSPDGNPDDIIDNHFGLAGGTVTVKDGEEFQTDGCGEWEFVG